MAHFFGTFNFKDAARHLRVGNERFVSRVIKNHRLVCESIIHPFFQAGTVNAHARGVIGEAEINHIRPAFRNLRQKIVFPAARHIDHTVEPFALGVSSRAPRHNIRVYIHRVNWVAHRHDVVGAEDVSDTAGVALCAVAHENLIGANLDASLLEIVLTDGFPQKRVTVFRAIAAESFDLPHLLRSF